MAKVAPSLSLLQRLGHMDLHHRQIIAIAIAVLCSAFFLNYERSPLNVFIVVWDVYVVIFLLMTWATIITTHPQTVHQAAKLQDFSRTFIFALVVAAACISVFAVIAVMQERQSLPQHTGGSHLFISVFTIMESWVFIHTVFVLHYAHIFHRERTRGRNAESGEGLRFPGEKNPDYLDFAYFSFVIGMTCQVSDVQITSRSIRRLALLHGLLSFIFNTIILAVSINILAGLFMNK